MEERYAKPQVNGIGQTKTTYKSIPPSTKITALTGLGISAIGGAISYQLQSDLGLWVWLIGTLLQLYAGLDHFTKGGEPPSTT